MQSCRSSTSQHQLQPLPSNSLFPAVSWQAMQLSAAQLSVHTYTSHTHTAQVHFHHGSTPTRVVPVADDRLCRSAAAKAHRLLNSTAATLNPDPYLAATQIAQCPASWHRTARSCSHLGSKPTMMLRHHWIAPAAMAISSSSPPSTTPPNPGVPGPSDPWPPPLLPP